MEVRVEKKGREGRRVAELFYENTAEISSGLFPDAHRMNKKKEESTQKKRVIAKMGECT